LTIGGFHLIEFAELNNRQKRLISIIVPIYRVEKYVSKCIDSLLLQTYSNIEIILVDDGSPDRCGEICDEYAAKDNRIKVIHKKNGGLSNARNAGVRVAIGEYIGFVDSDDYVSNNMYEKLYATIVTANAEMAICNYSWVNEDGLVCEKDYAGKIFDGVLNRDEAFAALYNQSNTCYVTAFNKLYKYSLLNTVRFPDGKIHEDEFTVHHFFDQCNTIACISDSLYFYVQRHGSITSEFSIKNLDLYEAYLDRYQFFYQYGIKTYAMQSIMTGGYSLLAKITKILNLKMFIRWFNLSIRYLYVILINPTYWHTIVKKLVIKSFH
jgi:glycosyltransferase involved in cell wall biosynthesis